MGPLLRAGTDRPLYVTRDYRLTYADDDLPTHYGFKGTFDLPRVLDRYREMTRLGREAYLAAVAIPANHEQIVARLGGAVEDLIAALGPDGGWIDREMIRSQAFIDNVATLARYIAAVRGPAQRGTEVVH